MCFYLSHVLFGSFGFAKMTSKQFTGLFGPFQGCRGSGACNLLHDAIFQTYAKGEQLLCRMLAVNQCPCSFPLESDGLRKGKMRDSKERRKTWFPSLFCPAHERSCTYKRCKYGVFTPIGLRNRLCCVQKERTNLGFSSPFDSSAFPCRSLSLSKESYTDMPLLSVYGLVDVRTSHTVGKLDDAEDFIRLPLIRHAQSV